MIFDLHNPHIWKKIEEMLYSMELYNKRELITLNLQLQLGIVKVHRL